MSFLEICNLLKNQINQQYKYFGNSMEEFSKTFSTSASRTRIGSNWMSSPNHKPTLRQSAVQSSVTETKSNPSQYSKLNSLTMSLYAQLQQLRHQNNNCAKNIQGDHSSLQNITAYSNLCSLNSEIEKQLKNKINKKVSWLDQQINEIFRSRTVSAKLYNKQMKQNIQQMSALKDKYFGDLNKSKARVYEPLRLQVALLKKQAGQFSKENIGFRSQIFGKLNAVRARLQARINQEERKRKSYNQIIHNLLEKSSEKAQQMLRRKL